MGSSSRHTRDMRISTISLSVDERVVLNVGGQIFVTLKSTLQNVPNTKLSRIDDTDPAYDAVMNEYYFDRSPRYFSYILDFYRTGRLHFSHCMCGPVIKAELEFWDIDENSIAACCWRSYKSFEDEKSTLDELKDLFKTDINTDLDHAHIMHDHQPIKKTEGKKLSWYQKWSKRIWKFIDQPTSSKGAQFWAIVMFLLILVSIATAALETHPLFRVDRDNSTVQLPSSTNEKLLMYYKTEAHPVFFIIDGVCVFVFSIELVLRVTCSPSKIRFFKSFYNIIDIICVLPFLITFIIHLIDEQFWLEREFIVVIGYLSLSSVLRIFRLFKMARHYKSFRLMVLAVKSSIRELLLLILLISMGMLIFSTLIYFAEFQVEGNFTNIPIGFWWSIVTMTTVGYGDINPDGLWGYLVGGICAVSGTLITGLPIPIIASNFNRYYNNARFITKIALRKDPKTKWINLDQRTLLEYAHKTTRRNGIVTAGNTRTRLNVEAAFDTNQSSIKRRSSSASAVMETTNYTNATIPSVHIECLEDSNVNDLIPPTPRSQCTDARSRVSSPSGRSMYSAHGSKTTLIPNVPTAFHF